MSLASIAAARIYIAMHEHDEIATAFKTANEPYRAVVDIGRAYHLHNVDDGSEDYEQLVFCLEMLVCN
jgi:hypothetical protein